MKILSVFFVVTLLLLASGCSTVTDKDLADLQSPNIIVKKEAIRRISLGRGFPFTFIDGFVSRANEKTAITLMVDLLGSGEEPKAVQLSILKALGELGQRADVPVSPLLERLKDKDHSIRSQATEALGKTRNKKALTALMKLLGGETNKYTIIWALGEIGDVRAIPTLNSLLASDDNYVRYNAYKALAKIGTAHEVEEDKSSNAGGLLDVGRMAFKKYQDMIIIVFRKIEGLKRAEGIVERLPQVVAKLN